MYVYVCIHDMYMWCVKIHVGLMDLFVYLICMFVCEYVCASVYVCMNVHIALSIFYAFIEKHVLALDSYYKTGGRMRFVLQDRGTHEIRTTRQGDALDSYYKTGGTCFS